MFVVEFHQGPDWMVGGAEFTSLQIRDLDVFLRYYICLYFRVFVNLNKITHI